MTKEQSQTSKAAFSSVGLLTKYKSSECLKALKRIFPVLKKFVELHPEVKIYWDREIPLKASHSWLKPVRALQVAEQSQLLLSLGGDGTLLRSARLLLETDAWKKNYLLGMNAGRLGFLTFINQTEVERSLEKILYSKRTPLCEKRSCLEVIVKRKKKKTLTFHALNDGVLRCGSLSRLVEFQVLLDGEFLSVYRADGLILSTPTGSTAYNLAAGGSILEPSVFALQITPICAQSFSNKPIVVSDEHSIQLQLGKNSQDVFLTLDGQTGLKLDPDDRILVRKSKKHIALLLPSSASSSHYLHSLRQKLKWGLVSPSAA
jgi:NAD+ kinase